jgi:hypothetical protein
MSDKVENCGNCAFGADEFRRFDYKCRRHAPIAVLAEHGVQKVWPPVASSDFCGDYELKDAT